MGRRDIIVIGGSAGATGVLTELLAALPADFPASLFIVTHVPTNASGILPEVLAAHSRLPVIAAADGQNYTARQVYVARPNFHLLLTPETIELGAGPRENMARPAIDPLFRSAALSCGPRVIALLLTGMLSDGASGLQAVARCGGVTIVQNPAFAHAPAMPRAGLNTVPTALVAMPDQLPELLAGLVAEEIDLPVAPPPANLQLEVDIARGRRLGSSALRTIADPAPLTCPQCQGVLSQVEEERPLRFRCQTGHAFTADILMEKKAGEVEAALRIALRVLEERLDLVNRMAKEALASGRSAVAALYQGRVQEYAEYAEVLQRAALAMMDPPRPEHEADPTRS